MQRIQKWKADDGTDFESEDECLAHEAMLAEIGEIMATLPVRPVDDRCSFSNGHGYLQHTPDTFWAARDALLRIGSQRFSIDWFDQALAYQDMDVAPIVRFVSETTPALGSALRRIACVDNKFREWGSPYYAAHPQLARNQHQIQSAEGGGCDKDGRL